MPKPFDTWTVCPHGPIEKVDDQLWRVQAPFPGAPFPRAMVVVKLADGRLVVHNAIALDDGEMKELEAWGKPAFLIVPNGGHRMDAKPFKERFPSVRVVAPPGARQRVEQVVKVDDTAGAFGDEAVRYEILDGTKEREGVLLVKSGTGTTTTLVFNDALMNMKSLPGFGGFMMGLFGFTSPAPKVTFPARMALVADKKALRAHLERLADVEGLARIEVGHGAPVTERAADALRAAAGSL
jgi:hypothetical protein